MTRITPLYAALCALAIGTATTAPHAATAMDSDDLAQVTVLPGWRMKNGNHMAALQITLKEGWHTYWRAPGGSGIPPRFDWGGSDNLAGVGLHWPVPTVYGQNGMRYIGYEDALVLPVEIVPDAAGNIELSGEISYGVCMDICMPMTSAFATTLDATDTAPDPRITAALAERPHTVTGAKCAADAIKDGMRIAATLNLPKIGNQVVAVIEHPDHDVWVSEATITQDGSRVTATSDLVPPTAAPFAIDRSTLTITVIDEGTAYEARGCTGG
ncbi:protein-disulfide reductase DsbD domain-containing protein [Celeribacter sp.]|uniref:protein-disulfide reductase DsbD domain-containing protein n=1 Tax=Celeribacter sp. TaxID=1890673 RepID=UPI003A901321